MSNISHLKIYPISKFENRLNRVQFGHKNAGGYNSYKSYLGHSRVIGITKKIPRMILSLWKPYVKSFQINF